MNYTTRLVLELILKKKYRRKEAVFLAGRIKKANQSPGFNWNKAIKGFSRKFFKEAREARVKSKEEWPESPDEEIAWIELILHFGDQEY